MITKQAATVSEIGQHVVDSVGTTIGKIPSSFLRGVAVGGLGSLGVMGLVHGGKSLVKTIFREPTLPEEIVIDIDRKKNRRKESTYKAALSKTAWNFDITKSMLLGAGLGTGALGVVKLVDYLDRASHKGDVATKIKELSDLYQERIDKKEKKASILDVMCQEKEAEYTNEQYNQTEKAEIVSEYLRGYKEAIASLLNDRDSMHKQAEADPKKLNAFTEIFDRLKSLDIIPLLYGATIPVGFTGGYYAASQMFPKISVEEEYKHPAVRFSRDDGTKSRTKKSSMEKQSAISALTLAGLAALSSLGGAAWYGYNKPKPVEPVISDFIAPALVAGGLAYGGKSLYDYANTNAPYGYSMRDDKRKIDKEKEEKNGI